MNQKKILHASLKTNNTDEQYGSKDNKILFQIAHKINFCVTKNITHFSYLQKARVF